MKRRLRPFIPVVSFFFIIVYVFNPTIALQTTNSLTCLDISSPNPLTEQYVFEPVDPETIVSGLKWSPDGTSLSASYVDTPVTDRSERIYLWDLATGESRVVFNRIDEPYAVTSSRIEWSPDGTSIALVFDGAVAVLDLEDNKVRNVAEYQFGAVAAVWSPDSTQLATIADNRITIWDVNTGSELQQINVDDTIFDHHTVWSGENGLRWIVREIDGDSFVFTVWQEDLLQPLLLLDGIEYELTARLSPSANFLAIEHREGIQVWNINDNEIVQTLNPAFGSEIIWSPDECYLAVVGGTIPSNSEGRTPRLQIWSVSEGTLAQAIDVPRTSTNVAWSPDGTALAYIDDEGAIHVWGLAQS